MHLIIFTPISIILLIQSSVASAHSSFSCRLSTLHVANESMILKDLKIKVDGDNL